MCVVEVKGKPALVPSCAFPVEEGMEVQTRSPRVINARRTIIQLLLASHPFDCLTCPKNGYCELQSLSSEYGIDRVPYKGKTRHHYTDFSSPSIIREPDKCILCGRCVRICEEIQGVAAIDFTRRGFDTMVLPPFEMDLSETTCVNCGQCTLACPTGALHEVRAVEKVMQTLQEGKKYLVAQAAPAIRVSLGDFFGLPPGTNVTGKVAAALRRMGFRQVFDTDFAADLTIMEEGTELVNRIKKNEKLPLFTSCCPAWVKYAEIYYPELLPNISTCKSPAGDDGRDDQELPRAEAEHRPQGHLRGLGDALHGQEVRGPAARAVQPDGRGRRGRGHHHPAAQPHDADLRHRVRAAFPRRSSTGPSARPRDRGTSSPPPAASWSRRCAPPTTCSPARTCTKLEFEDVRGMTGVKEAAVTIGEQTIRLAVANRLANARQIAERVKQGDSPWDFIEVMACPGGCAGGGGQLFGYDPERVEKRIKAIYSLDKSRTVRLSYKNPAIAGRSTRSSSASRDRTRRTSSCTRGTPRAWRRSRRTRRVRRSKAGTPQP